MIMQMSKETYDKMNYLLGKSFDCNAQTDNFAYNIDYARYPVTADIPLNQLFVAPTDSFPDNGDTNLPPIQMPYPSFTILS